MALDQAKNFAKATVSTGYDASASTIVLSGGHGAKLPTVPFNVVWWNSTDYADPSDDPNVEIVRVTAKSTDTLTVTRAQESITATTKNTGGKTYKMIAGLTALGANSLITGTNVVAKYNIDIRTSTYYAVNPNTNFSTSSASLDTVWTAVLADIGSNTGVIEFGIGTFITTGGLSINKSGIKIKGQGKGVTIIQADSGSALDSIKFFGTDPTQSATSYSLTANAVAGDLTVTVSAADAVASGLATGDYFILYSSLSIDSEFTGHNQGEIHKVLSVNSGTGLITIGVANNGTHVYETTTTANTAKIAKLSMYQDISLEGITFLDTATSRPDTLGNGQVLFRFIDDLTIRDCVFKSMFNSALEIAQCMNVKIESCFFKDIKDVTPAANTFYGIDIRGATTNCSVANCNFDNMRHGVAMDSGRATFYAGKFRDVSIVGNSSISTYSAHFDCHQGGEGISFVGNTMVGDDGSANGIQARSPCVITGNSIIGVLGRGISIFGNGSGSNISGNYIKGCTTGVYLGNGVNRININGNSISNGVDGIRLEESSKTVTISNASPAVITSAAHTLQAGTQIRFTTTGTLPTGLSLLTTYYILAGTTLTKDSFTVSLTDGGAAINTSSAGSGTHTIRYTSGNDSIVCSNYVYDNSGFGLNSNSQTRVKVSGNYFRNNTYPIQIGDAQVKASDWMITDNYSVAHTTSNYPIVAATLTNTIMNGNVGFNSVQKGYTAYSSGPQTLDANHSIVNCTSGTFTLNLPTAVNITGRQYTIKNSGTGVITVDGSGSETIDGQTTWILSVQYDSITIVSNGANWIIT